MVGEGEAAVAEGEAVVGEGEEASPGLAAAVGEGEALVGEGALPVLSAAVAEGETLVGVGRRRHLGGGRGGGGVGSGGGGGGRGGRRRYLACRRRPAAVMGSLSAVTSLAVSEPGSAGADRPPAPADRLDSTGRHRRSEAAPTAPPGPTERRPSHPTLHKHPSRHHQQRFKNANTYINASHP